MIEAVGAELRTWLSSVADAEKAEKEAKAAQDKLNSARHAILQAAEAVKTAVAKQTALEPCGPNGLQRFVLDYTHEGEAFREVFVEVAGGEVKLMKAHKV